MNEIINKAIEVNDCIIINGETCIPVELDGNTLYYYDRSLDKLTVNITEVQIEACE